MNLIENLCSECTTHLIQFLTQRSALCLKCLKPRMHTEFSVFVHLILSQICRLRCLLLTAVIDLCAQQAQHFIFFVRIQYACDLELARLKPNLHCRSHAGIWRSRTKIQPCETADAWIPVFCEHSFNFIPSRVVCDHPYSSWCLTLLQVYGIVFDEPACRISLPYLIARRSTDITNYDLM